MGSPRRHVLPPSLCGGEPTHLKSFLVALFLTVGDAAIQLDKLNTMVLIQSQCSGGQVAALNEQRQGGNSYHNGQCRLNTVQKGLTHNGQHRQGEFYNGMTHMDI